MISKWAQLSRVQVPLLIALHFFVGFVFWYGIEKIFLAKELGIGPTGIATIVALYTVLNLILDVPASVVADRWGRRKMLIMSVLFFVVANIVLGGSLSFFVYLIGTIFWALFTVSYNGTYEAILFDRLKEEKREKDFQKIDAWSRLYFMLGVALSSFVSGFLAEYVGLRGIYFLSIIPLLLAVIALVFIREPQVNHNDEFEDVINRGYISHLMHAFNVVIKNSTLRIVAFGMIILAFVQTPMYEFNQYIYIELFKSPTVVGMFGGFSGLMLSIGFFVAIKRKINVRVLIILTGLSIIGISILANNFALFFLAFTLSSCAVLENGLQAQLQHSTTSRTRASVTSAVLFLGNLLVVPFAFFFGIIAEHDSIWLAYLINGIIISVFAIIYFVITKSTKNTIPTQ